MSRNWYSKHIEQTQRVTVKLNPKKNNDAFKQIPVILGTSKDFKHTRATYVRVRSCGVELSGIYNSRSPSDGPIIPYHFSICNDNTRTDDPKTWESAAHRGGNHISSDVNTISFKKDGPSVFKMVRGTGMPDKTDFLDPLETIDFDSIWSPYITYQLLMIYVGLVASDFEEYDIGNKLECAPADVKKGYEKGKKVEETSEKKQELVKTDENEDGEEITLTLDVKVIMELECSL